MATTRTKTIGVKHPGYRKEREGTGVISPGDLVEVLSTDNIQRHSTANGSAQKSFAMEDANQGKAIDENYAAGDRVQYNVVQSGGEILARLDNGEAVVIGDKLSSAGNGKLQLFSEDSAGAVQSANLLVGIALQAKDMSDSSGADPAEDTFIIEIA